MGGDSAADGAVPGVCALCDKPFTAASAGHAAHHLAAGGASLEAFPCRHGAQCNGIYVAVPVERA